MPTPPPSAVTAPTEPDRSDRSTFPARAQAWTSWEKGTFHPFQIAIGNNVHANAVEANAAAVNALNASVAALNGVNLPNWVSGTTYALNARVLSPANGVAYRRIVAGAGTTDPSTDTTNWAGFGIGSSAFAANDSIVSTTAGWTSSRIVNYVSSGYAVTGHTHAGIYALASHTHGSAQITDFNSAVNALISASGAGTSGMPARPIYDAGASSNSLGNADQVVKATFAGQCNITLPANPTVGRIIEIVPANGRTDVAVYIGAGTTMTIGGVTLSAGDYLLLDTGPDDPFLIQYLDTTRHWRRI